MIRFLAKCSVWALLTIAAMVFSLSMAFAEVIREHDRQDMALQEAIKLCQAKGGKFSWSMPERYRLTDDPKGYRIIGNELLVVCKIPQAATFRLSWVPPQTDMKITAYRVYVDGLQVATVTESPAILQGLPIHGIVAMQTVFESGIESDISPGVEF